MDFDIRTTQKLEHWDNQFDGISCDKVARLIHSLSFDLTADGSVAVKGKPKEKVARDYLQRKLTKQVPEFLASMEDGESGNTASRFLGAYSLLQILPSAEILTQLSRKIESHMDRIDSDLLVRTLGYFASLGVYPADRFIEQWGRVAVPHSATWDVTDKYRAIYQLAILDYLGTQDGSKSTSCRDILLPMMDDISKNADELFPDTVDGRVYYAALWLQNDFIKTRRIQNRDETISSDEVALVDGLKTKGMQVNESYILPQTERRFDLVVKFNRHCVGIEIDGPSHFVYDAENKRMQYDGSTRFHTELSVRLMGDDFRLLRIPFTQFEKKSPIENIQKTLRCLNGVAKGAAYIMRGVESVRATSEVGAWDLKFDGPY